MLFLESIARPLLLLHMLTGVAAAAVAIHLMVRLARTLKRGKRARRSEALHGRLLLWIYGACFTLGALVYPTFRVRVRHEYFDTSLPLATGFFEIKEHLPALGLVAAVAAWRLTRADGEQDPGAAPGACIAFTSVSLAALVLNIVIGFYLTLLRSI